jgi:hypothetical protein
MITADVSALPHREECLVMRNHRSVTILLTTTALLCAPCLALSQTAAPTVPASGAQTHVPLQKTIGQASQAKSQVFPSLFVLNSRGATLQGGKLTLTGLSPNAIVFADRPVRAAGHDLTANVLELWSPENSNSESFAKDPPNATVSAFKKDGSGVSDAVVVLMSPRAEGDRVTFDVQVLEGDLTGGDGAASIFIDIIGRPFTPLSFAGVARRSAFRGAMYAGAVGAAAVGAAAYANPYYNPYYRPPCGAYPYPPCY